MTAALGARRGFRLGGSEFVRIKRTIRQVFDRAHQGAKSGIVDNLRKMRLHLFERGVFFLLRRGRDLSDADAFEKVLKPVGRIGVPRKHGSLEHLLVRFSGECHELVERECSRGLFKQQLHFADVVPLVRQFVFFPVRREFVVLEGKNQKEELAVESGPQSLKGVCFVGVGLKLSPPVPGVGLVVFEDPAFFEEEFPSFLRKLNQQIEKALAGFFGGKSGYDGFESVSRNGFEHGEGGAGKVHAILRERRGTRNDSSRERG